MDRAGKRLELRDVPPPAPAAGQLLLRVRACGVCRTDLHIVDGELPAPEAAARPRAPDRRPRRRREARGSRPGARVGVPVARLDLRHLPLLPLRPREPLRRRAVHRLRHRRRLRRARGRRRALLLPASRRLRRRAGRAAPLRGPDRLPVAAAGRRRASGSGIYGFGAAAHIVAQVARAPGAPACSPSRARATSRRSSSRSSSAPSGRATRRRRPRASSMPRSSSRRSGALVPAALKAVRKGGHGRLRRHPHERHPGVSLRAALGRAGLRSVANLTRADGEEFLALAPSVPVRTQVETFRLPTRTRRWTGSARGTCAAPP